MGFSTTLARDYDYECAGVDVSFKKADPRTQRSPVVDSLPPLDENDTLPKIIAKGITHVHTDEDVKGHFEQYGRITDFLMPFNRATGKPRGFCFVTYAPDDQPKAKDILGARHVVAGVELNVERVDSRRRRRSTP